MSNRADYPRHDYISEFLVDNPPAPSKVQWVGKDGDDPYAELITRFMEMEFPQVSGKGTESVMEAVLEEFLTTKAYRDGPRPNPEGVVAMRDVLRGVIGAGLPIPVLSLSAAVKVPLGRRIDLAELSAIRIMACLQERVQRHYQPGLAVTWRMEDLTELVLSADVAGVADLTSDYVQRFQTLVEVLGYDRFIFPKPESLFTSAERFTGLARSMAPDFLRYLQASTLAGDAQHELNIVAELGWRGAIGFDVRDYLRQRYQRVYGDRYNQADHYRMMAEYFAATLTRHKLGAVGMPAGMKRMEVAFNPPLPNAPKVSTRVQYRSVPYSQSSDNRPFWYAKGYLSIDNQNNSKLKLGNWQEKDYHCGELVLSNGIKSVAVDADYVLEDEHGN